MDPLRPDDPLTQEWVLLVFLFALVMHAWTNMSAPRKWRMLFSGVLRRRLGRQAMREDMDLQDRTLIALLLGALAIIALFLYQALLWYGLLEPGSLRYARLVGAGAAVMVAQLVVAHITSTLFMGDGGLAEFVRTTLLFYILLGMVLLPITMLLSYQVMWRGALLWIGVGLAVLILAYRWLRGVLIGLDEGVPLRHIILYLCAAEAVPVLMAYRELQEAAATATNP